MKYRKNMTRKGSRRLFSKTASLTHKKNTFDYVMRGGTRL
jgi:hypothetical protein